MNNKRKYRKSWGGGKFNISFSAQNVKIKRNFVFSNLFN